MDLTALPQFIISTAGSHIERLWRCCSNLLPDANCQRTFIRDSAMQDLVGTLQEDTKEMPFSNARSGWCTCKKIQRKGNAGPEKKQLLLHCRKLCFLAMAFQLPS
jgi:hypothetical protein